MKRNSKDLHQKMSFRQQKRVQGYIKLTMTNFQTSVLTMKMRTKTSQVKVMTAMMNRPCNCKCFYSNEGIIKSYFEDKYWKEQRKNIAQLQNELSKTTHRTFQGEQKKKTCILMMLNIGLLKMIKGDIANKVRKDVNIKCCRCDVFLVSKLFQRISQEIMDYIMENKKK